MCAMSEKAGERPTEYQLCAEGDCPFWNPSPFGEVDYMKELLMIVFKN